MALLSEVSKSATPGGKRLADALQMGLTVAGLTDIKEGLHDFAAYAVYVSTITSKRMAEAIHLESQKHVPYRTGLLFESSRVVRMEGPDPNTGSSIFTKATVIEANVEGTDAYIGTFAADVPLVAPTWAVAKGKYGFDIVSKWAVGYNVDSSANHAVEVHENPSGRKWMGGIDHPGKGKGPYAGELKTSHFLANAFDYYAPQFSGVMTRGLQAAMDCIHRASAGRTQRAAVEARAISTGRITGGLVSKGGRR